MNQECNFSNTASPKLQNKINGSILFHPIRQNSPISRAGISKHLKSSAPAVSKTAARLLEKRGVLETKKALTKNGKRPFLLAYNKNRSRVFNIDLAKQKARMALTNLDNEILWERESFQTEDKKEIIDSLKGCIRDAIRLKTGSIEAVSIALPAIIDAESAHITGGCLYDRWRGINFKKTLQHHFGSRTFVDDDVNLWAMGGKNYGKGKTSLNLYSLQPRP